MQSFEIPCKTSLYMKNGRLAPTRAAQAQQPELLKHRSLGDPSDVMVFQHVLVRTAKADCNRPYPSFSPSSDSAAMYVFCEAR